jgi:hypothetical protein
VRLEGLGPFKNEWGNLVLRINVENVIKLGFYWNKCILYIKIEALLKYYSILFIDITQSI